MSIRGGDGPGGRRLEEANTEREGMGLYGGRGEGRMGLERGVDGVAGAGGEGGHPFTRPLCNNCGRRSLQRVIDMTELTSPTTERRRVASRLPQTKSSPPVQVGRGNLRIAIGPPTDRGGDQPPPPDNASVSGRSQSPSQEHAGSRKRAQWCGEIVRGNVKCTMSGRGRFAEWVCRSGALLCSPCLRAMRFSEVALERVATPPL